MAIGISCSVNHKGSSQRYRQREGVEKGMETERGGWADSRRKEPLTMSLITSIPTSNPPPSPASPMAEGADQPESEEHFTRCFVPTNGSQHSNMAPFFLVVSFSLFFFSLLDTIYSLQCFFTMHIHLEAQK